MAAVMEGLWASWAPLSTRALRSVLSNATRKITIAARPFSSATWSTAARQPIHPSAVQRQFRRGPQASLSSSSSSSSSSSLRALCRRFFSGSPLSSAVRQFQPQPYHNFNKAAATCRQWIESGTFRNAGRASPRSPFVSTLRPNLAGGGTALPRGLGVRCFSHTPAAPAEVVQSVSQAMRAFLSSGQRARYDGLGLYGEKRYRAVSLAEEETARQVASVPAFAPGAYIDFRLQPNITALTPVLADAFPFPTAAARHADAAEVNTCAAPEPTLNMPDFLPFLAGDFDRAARELAIVHADLARLASLGDLPIALPSPGVLRVRFPGVDADTVELLCEDIGVRRGIVGEDKPTLFGGGDGDMSLQIPFAPESLVSRRLTSPGGTLRSQWGNDVGEAGDTPSVEDEDELFMQDAYNRAESWMSDPDSKDANKSIAAGKESKDYEGLDGIYRFLEECSHARGRYESGK